MSDRLWRSIIPVMNILAVVLSLIITKWGSGDAGILESIAGMRRSICIIVGGCGDDGEFRVCLIPAYVMGIIKKIGL